MIKLHYNQSSPLSRMYYYAIVLRDRLRGYARSYNVEIGLNNSVVSKRIAKYISRGQYEFDEIELALNTLKNQTRILELGGGIGFVSAMLQTHLKDSHVTSFEANPETAKAYKDTMERNRLGRYRLHNRILKPKASGQETERFYLDDLFWGSSTHKRGENQKFIDVTIEDQAEFLAMNKFDALIMDIEGGEYEFVTGLKGADFNDIFMELHQDVLGIEKTRELISHLVKIGYTLENGSTDNPPAICHFKIK